MSICLTLIIAFCLILIWRTENENGEEFYLDLASDLEFKAVMVLPKVTRNYGNYPYGKYVGNAP